MRYPRGCLLRAHDWISARALMAPSWYVLPHKCPDCDHQFTFGCCRGAGKRHLNALRTATRCSGTMLYILFTSTFHRSLFLYLNIRIDPSDSVVFEPPDTSHSCQLAPPFGRTASYDSCDTSATRISSSAMNVDCAGAYSYFRQLFPLNNVCCREGELTLN